MLPTVLLLLSVFTVRGSACDDLKRAAIDNLQDTIKNEEETGFRKVFPKNYYVQHYFNGSTQCEDSCCVASAAFLLADSWKQLLQHIEWIHMKHKFISELIMHLNTIWKESFQETPNPSVFPSGPSSPRALLTYTSDVLSKWLALNCPVEICIFPSPAPQQEKQQSGTDREPVETQSVSVKEGEREKRWLTAAATNGDVRLSGWFLCVLCCLRMLLDVLLKELG
ncbi:hypothetical protein KOW79_000549 [Hemibagrus wyckioides]|uniref:Uncharacterized protein n=1 Tax=Hemibagrus wyckioides TaxID=337641 RepID=A0A9D3SSK6_9TELE|nr:uncharacterized protein zgc:174888 [Hemibagrus wyckioides]KAG7335856.1 hypothetical protein KOW79_000549 [Hemibagrus wyckioides]